MSLGESLELTEEDVIRKVTRSGLPPFRSVDRFRAPRRYVISTELKRKRTFARDEDILNLRPIFWPE